MLSVVPDDCGQWLPAVLSIELVVHTNRPMFSFQLLLGYSLIVWAENFRFQQALIKILSSELNIFHFIASLLHMK